ncbi:MAG: 30S ribosomal protein S4 [Chthonomonadales bacterium]|nr:30S ribosomal protein S4 [Chthonomonadales bacterium]
MATSSYPRCRLCRREGQKLFLKGDRCTQKCPMNNEKRAKPPGMHGDSVMRRKVTEYGTQLREKQKLRRIYGIIEGQFRRYMDEAMRRRGVTGENLLQQLEMRLDNVVYRLGLAVSRSQARQLVSHRFFTVNGRRVNIPSYQVRPGDVVGVHESKNGTAIIKAVREKLHTRGLPEWLEFNHNEMTGRILQEPERRMIDTEVQEQLIVEFYSR